MSQDPLGGYIVGREGVGGRPYGKPQAATSHGRHQPLGETLGRLGPSRPGRPSLWA
jgi:hypothetical protein